MEKIMDIEMTEKLKALEAQVAVIKDEGLRRIAFEKLLEASLPTRTVAENVAEGQGKDLSYSSETDIGTFFSKISHDKPSENALALAAFHFSQYGSADFAVSDINSLAQDVGVTIPERL